MALTILPEEIITIIGSQIDVDDLLNLCKISRGLETLCHNPQFWKNLILSSRDIMFTIDNFSIDQLISLYRKIGKSGYLYVLGSGSQGVLGLGNVNCQLQPIEVVDRNDVCQVSYGGYHSAVVTLDGHIHVFGYNFYSQLGLGDHNSRYIPTQIPGFSNVVQVSCGYEFTAFVTANGQLYTFGRNYCGQFGNFGSYLSRPTLFDYLVGKKIVQVSCGYAHMGILTDPGEVYVFGSGASGQLGLGPQKISTSTPVHLAINQKIKQISCNDNVTALLTYQGDVYICGQFKQLFFRGVENTFWLEKIYDLPPIQEISLGPNYSLFLTDEGEVYSYGDNIYSQIGMPKNVIYQPIKIDNLPPIKQIAAAGTHSVFLSTQGDVYICGTFGEGILEFKEYKVITVPLLIPGISQVRQIFAGLNRIGLII